MKYKNIIFLFILSIFSCEKHNNKKVSDRCFVTKYSHIDADADDEGSLCFIECLNYSQPNTILSKVECKEWFGKRVFVKNMRPE